MNIQNDDLSVKEDTNTKTARKQNQWTINDSKIDIESIDKSPHSSAESLIIPPTFSDNQDESLNSDSGIKVLSEAGNISSSTRRKNYVLSDSESSRSLTSTSARSNSRRRALSTASRPKDRFSMHELGYSIMDDADAKLLLPTRHSMAFDNSFNINTRKSLEDREWTIDRERIGNAGKGFGNLINDGGGKDSIADLIANVKDEDAVKIALITQKHAGQKNRIRNTDTDIEKIAQKNENLNFEFHLSETTLTNSRTCKLFLENKYNVLFEIIRNNGVYNPLTIVKNRQNDLATRERSDHSLGSSSVSSRIKSRGPLRRRKELSIWDVSNVSNTEMIKEYKQRNAFDQVHVGNQITCANSHEATSNEDKDKDYSVFKMESESDEAKKQQKHSQLLQIFNPPRQEIQTMSQPREKAEERNSSEQLKVEKHFKPSSLDSITTISKGKEDSYGKSKKWPINLFKRKDKKHKNELSSSDVGIPEDSLISESNAKKASDSSSGGQTPRSSLEDTLPEKGSDLMQQINSESITHSNEKYYEPESKYEKNIPEENLGHSRIPADYLTDDASSQRSFDSHSSNSFVGFLNDGQYDGDEQHESAEYSESEEGCVDQTEPVRETVSVNLDIFPQELVDIMAEQGIVDRNADNRHFVELDKSDNRLIEMFKFRKLISYDVDLLDLQISLVCDNVEDTRSLDQQFSDKIIKRCDEYIEGATKLLENNEILLAERIDFIKDHNYIPSISNASSFFTNSNISADNFNHQNHLPMYKMNIEEGIKLLNNKLVNIESTVNRLERQHASFTEEMKTIQDSIEEMTTDANNQELKNLEDEIHLLTAEEEKSPWLDVFYLMMSYVLAGIMFTFWFIVACFKLFKKALLLLNRIWKLVLSPKLFH